MVGKMMRDPTALGDMWSGPGNDVYPREAEEGTNWEGGRSWKDCSPQWKRVNDDGFTSVMSAILNKAAVIGEGDEELSVGGEPKGKHPGSETPSQLGVQSGQVGVGYPRSQGGIRRSFHGRKHEARSGEASNGMGWGGGRDERGLKMVPEDQKVLLLSDFRQVL